MKKKDTHRHCGFCKVAVTPEDRNTHFWQGQCVSRLGNEHIRNALRKAYTFHPDNRREDVVALEQEANRRNLDVPEDSYATHYCCLCKKMAPEHCHAAYEWDKAQRLPCGHLIIRGETHTCGPVSPAGARLAAVAAVVTHEERYHAPYPSYVYERTADGGEKLTPLPGSMVSDTDWVVMPKAVLRQWLTTLDQVRPFIPSKDGHYDKAIDLTVAIKRYAR